MSESRPGSGMALGAVFCPSAQVDEGQSRTRRFGIRNEGKKGQRERRTEIREVS